MAALSLQPARPATLRLAFAPDAASARAAESPLNWIAAWPVPTPGGQESHPPA